MLKSDFYSFLLKILFVCSIWVNVSCALANSLPIPSVAYVNDTAQLLSVEQKARLEKKLEQFEKDFGSQIGVIIVPSLQGETIEAYAHRVGDQWKLGRKNIGDGLLFIVALKEHRVRIDVFRALEGAIPDVTASRILNEAVIPAFKTEQYYLGINQGLDRIFACIKNENLPKPGEESDSVFDQALWDQPWVAIIFIGWVATMMLRQLLGRKRAAPIAGLVVGSFGTFVMQSVVAGIIIAVIAVSACMLIPDRVLEAGTKRTQRMYRTRRRRRGDNSIYPGYGDGGMGGHGSGHGSSSGMGGGSGSGGGGDSGGGGASGSW